MKKFLSLFALLMLFVTSAVAGSVFTYTLNGEATSNPEGFFSYDTTGKFNFNAKFTGEYDGVSYSKGLKMEGTTKILFSTTEESNVTIVQSTWSDNTIKLDDEELAVADAVEGTGCRVYTVSGVAAGDHTITRGSGESGLFLVKVEYTAEEATPTTATFNFADPNFREHIGETMTDVKGFVYNETFTAEGATLQITGGSAPSRIYVDSNRGQNLVTYKEYTTLTFRAPKGKAITKIEFTAAGNSNIKNFTASSGAIEDMTWTGNAEGVRFAQGGTSYLANAIVSMVSKNAETAALPAIEYVECENIAAFNALENGTYAKVTLTNAEISAISADGYSTTWIQDATGGAMIQYTSLNAALQEKTKVSGTVYVAKRVASGNTQMKETEDTPESAIETSPIETFSMVEGTIAEVNVAANLGKVVKITGATLTETSATAGTLTQGETSISVNNGTETANQQLHKIAEWEKDRLLENVTIVAVLVAKSASENQLLPLSVVKDEPTGISRVDAAAGNVTIYSLQGVRLNQLQKGLNIVNGKKIVVK